MSLKELLAPIAEDLLGVNTVIRDRLSSQVPLIQEIAGHIIHAGGKRLRPALTLLAAGSCGGVNAHARELAAVIEFVHTATLLHDDVVDSTSLRRGRITANAQWSNSAAVLSGDFLYSRAFQMMVGVGQMAVMQVMANATNAIAEGEVLQLLNARNPAIDEAAYLKVIELKTAVLFRAASELGAIAADASPDAVRALGEYGRELGIAYQLADDILDFTASPEESGKAVGNDLAEGKATLPIIHALRNSDDAFRNWLQPILRSGDLGDAEKTLARVQANIESSKAIPYTRALADHHVQAAKAAVRELPDSPYKAALLQLADFATARSH